MWYVIGSLILISLIVLVIYFSIRTGLWGENLKNKLFISGIVAAMLAILSVVMSRFIKSFRSPEIIINRPREVAPSDEAVSELDTKKDVVDSGILSSDKKIDSATETAADLDVKKEELDKRSEETDRKIIDGPPVVSNTKPDNKVVNIIKGL